MQEEETPARSDYSIVGTYEGTFQRNDDGPMNHQSPMGNKVNSQSILFSMQRHLQ